MSTSARRGGPLAVPLLVVMYAFIPGDPSGLVSGWPWRDTGGIVLVVSLLAAMLAWAVSGQRQHRAWITALALAVVGRVLLASLLLPAGWLASYTVRDDNGPHLAERIGPRLTDRRTIDRAIDLSDQSPTLQFLNDRKTWFSGLNAATLASFEARWNGFLFLDADTPVSIAVTHPDGQAALDGGEIEPGPRTLSAGAHQLSVLLDKAADRTALFRVAIAGPSGPVPVYARPVSGADLRTDRLERQLLRALDVGVLLLALVWVARLLFDSAAALRSRGADTNRSLSRGLVALPVLLFSLHGLVAAHQHAVLSIFMSGDDMRDYAASARDIALHGLLGNQGLPLFQGDPFFFYPLYPYFVAMSHRLFDESFYGTVLLQFVLLGAAFAGLARLAERLFGLKVAWATLLVLCTLGELDFARYYTVSVFTDNLYYPLVAGAVVALHRLETTRSTSSAIAAGLLGGLATITRPSMFFVLPLVVLWYFRPRANAPSGMKPAVVKMGIAWTAMILAVTLRNWLVSGRVVLIAESSLQVIFFLAPPGVDWRHYLIVRTPSITQTLQGAFRLFLDYPWQTTVVELRKFAFMLGFTNLGGYSLHPEFLGLSATYLGFWLIKGRQMPAATTHLTLLGHVVAFEIASPTTYGYKTILTLMMLMAPFGATFLWESFDWLMGRRPLARSGSVEQA